MKDDSREPEIDNAVEILYFRSLITMPEIKKIRKRYWKQKQKEEKK